MCRAFFGAHGYLTSFYCRHWPWPRHSVMKYLTTTFGFLAGAGALTPKTWDLSTFTTSQSRPSTAASREGGAP